MAGGGGVGRGGGGGARFKDGTALLKTLDGPRVSMYVAIEGCAAADRERP